MPLMPSSEAPAWLANASCGEAVRRRRRAPSVSVQYYARNSCIGVNNCARRANPVANTQSNPRAYEPNDNVPAESKQFLVDE
jgi:hypothetical protein